jgi:hypothetical protein
VRAEDFGPRYYAMNGRPMTQMEWARAFEHDRHISLDYIRLRGHMYRVSTVWLGLDHNFWPGGPPLIFETIVFEDDDMGGFENLMNRYSTLAEAERGHRMFVRAVKRIVRSRTTKQLIKNGRKPTATGRPTARK